MADLLDVTETNWEAEVLNSDTPVLVDFWAPWCGPCKMLMPTVEAVARELDGRVKVVKLNTQTDGHVAAKYGVQGIPVLMLFKNGQPVDQLMGGPHPKARILQKIEGHLS